jgi:hypothetical protein
MGHVFAHQHAPAEAGVGEEALVLGVAVHLLLVGCRVTIDEEALANPGGGLAGGGEAGVDEVGLQDAGVVGALQQQALFVDDLHRDRNVGLGQVLGVVIDQRAKGAVLGDQVAPDPHQLSVFIVHASGEGDGEVFTGAKAAGQGHLGDIGHEDLPPGGATGGHRLKPGFGVEGAPDEPARIDAPALVVDGVHRDHLAGLIGEDHALVHVVRGHQLVHPARDQLGRGAGDRTAGPGGDIAKSLVVEPIEHLAQLVGVGPQAGAHLRLGAALPVVDGDRCGDAEGQQPNAED